MFEKFLRDASTNEEKLVAFKAIANAGLKETFDLLKRFVKSKTHSPEIRVEV